VAETGPLECGIFSKISWLPTLKPTQANELAQEYRALERVARGWAADDEILEARWPSRDRPELPRRGRRDQKVGSNWGSLVAPSDVAALAALEDADRFSFVGV